MLLGPGLRRALTSVHLDKERQAAGAAAGHGGGHGRPMRDSYEPGYVLATMRPGPLPGKLAGNRHAPEPG
jgi:hypothetical protein